MSCLVLSWAAGPSGAEGGSPPMGSSLAAALLDSDSGTSSHHHHYPRARPATVSTSAGEQGYFTFRGASVAQMFCSMCYRMRGTEQTGGMGTIYRLVSDIEPFFPFRTWHCSCIREPELVLGARLAAAALHFRRAPFFSLLHGWHCYAISGCRRCYC